MSAWAPGEARVLLLNSNLGVAVNDFEGVIKVPSQRFQGRGIQVGGAGFPQRKRRNTSTCRLQPRPVVWIQACYDLPGLITSPVDFGRAPRIV